MARFEDALPTVLRHEGLYSEDPADPGGATNYGISLRFLRQLGDTDGDGFAEGDLDPLLELLMTQEIEERLKALRL